jgi:hypothetical protein
MIRISDAGCPDADQGTIYLWYGYTLLQQSEAKELACSIETVAHGGYEDNPHRTVVEVLAAAATVEDGQL